MIKAEITNTLVRTLLFITVLLVLSLLLFYACTGKSNNEDDTFKQSVDKDLKLDTGEANTSIRDSKMAR